MGVRVLFVCFLVSSVLFVVVVIAVIAVVETESEYITPADLYFCAEQPDLELTETHLPSTPDC